MYLARKFTRAKWEISGLLLVGEIPADAVSADLRTFGNTLSFWMCDDISDVSLKEVVLAMASGGDRIDKFDLMWIARSDVDKAALAVAQTDGLTAVARMMKRHVDIEHLDLVRLGKVAQLVHVAVQNSSYRRFVKSEVQTILLDAIASGELQLDNVKSTLRTELKELISKAR